MKKKFAVFLYLFIFITLLLCCDKKCFAASAQEIVDNIASDETTMVRDRIVNPDRNGQYIEDNYNVVISKDNDIAKYVNNGKIDVDGESYSLDIRIKPKDSDTYTSIVQRGGKLSVDSDGNYRLQLKFQNAGNDLYRKVAQKEGTGALFNAGDYDIEYVLVSDKGEEIKAYNNNMVLSSENTRTGEGDVGIGDLLVDGIFKNSVAVIVRLITETLSKISLPTGDAFLHMISMAVKEKVSIDAIVYDKVEKLNIDFFDNSGDSTDSSGGVTSLKNIMKPVITKWYAVFQGIAIVVFLIMLVYMGIRIILASTGDKKATYKGIVTAWFIGIIILMFFPYVMKYSIKLNHALCAWIGRSSASFYGGQGNLEPVKGEVDGIKNVISKYRYGTDEFVAYMAGISDINSKTLITGNEFGSNAMMRIRYIAGKTFNLPLTVVYFILIGQLIALLIMYYKRVFMLAFLITIFPLVAAFYPINKIGAARMNCFGIWFKEFLINVFVQSFHAVTYTVITMVGINAYLETDNWLFMILCILFLFEGEKIIRAIFNAKSSINTIGDMAMSGLVAANIAKNMWKMVGTKDKTPKEGTKTDPSDLAERDRNRARNNLGLGGATGTGTASNDGNIVANSSGSMPLGRNVPSAGGIFNNISGLVDNRASNGGLGKAMNLASRGIGGVASGLTQAAGGTLGFTFGMAQRDNKKGLDTAVAGAVTGLSAGKELGKGAKSIVGGVTGKISNIYAGHVMANEILNGEHDDELGLNEADKIADAEKQKAYREIYAKVARKRGHGNKTGAEIMFIKEQLSQMKK